MPLNLDSALSSAASGLRAAQARIAVLSDNIANADVAGYTAKSLETTAFQVGALSNGVRIGVVDRTVDSALQQSLLSTNSDVGALSARAQTLKAINEVQGTPGAGASLSDRMTALQTSFSTLLGAPSSVPQQAAVVEAASGLADSINAMAGAVATQRDAAQAQIVAIIDDVNAALRSADQLTHEIKAAVAAGESTADLQDQRDLTLQTISGALDVRYIKQDDGGLEILGRNGFSLPLTATLSTTSTNLSPGEAYSPNGGGAPAIMLSDSDAGQPARDVTTRLAGGALGELVALRDSTLPGYTAQLDEFSQKLATRFQQQGLTLFTDGSGAIPGGPAGAPTSYVGFSSDIQVNPAVLAAPHLVRDGTDSIAAGDPPPHGGPFTVNDVAAGGPAGFSTLIERVLTYSLGANIDAGTPHAPFASSGLGANGTLRTAFLSPPTLGDYATLIVAGQSTDAAQADAALSNATSFQTTLSARLSDQSGVNVDREMGLMIQLQNSYQANARIMQASQTMFAALVAAISASP